MQIIYIFTRASFLLTAFLCCFLLRPIFAAAWVQPVFYGDKQLTNSVLLPYSSYAGGLLLGADKKIADNALLGIGFNYFNVTQRYSLYPNLHIDVLSYLGFLYGTMNFAHDLQLDWQASAGVNNYKQRYILTSNLDATASYNGQQYLVRAVGSKKYQKSFITFIPQINANILYLHQNPYYENINGLQGGTSNSGVFTLGVGFKMSSQYSRAKLKTIPEVRALVFYDVFTADVNALTAMLVGGPALRTSATPTRSAGQFGIGITFMAYRNFNIALNYDMLIKGLYFNNIVGLRFNWVC